MAQLSIVAGDAVQDRSLARALIPALELMVRVWEPDRGRAHSYRFGTRSRGPGDAFPYLCGCWAAYIPEEQMAQAVLPVDVLVKSVPYYGSLVSATDDVFNVDDARHVRIAHSIQQAVEPIWSTPSFS